MNATDVEIYNAIDGSVYFSPEDMEELTAAVQRTATDPMAFIEVGRIYVAMIYKVVKHDRERSSNFYRDAFNAAFPEFPSIRYEVTKKGKDQAHANDHVHPTIVDALRNGGVL